MIEMGNNKENNEKTKPILKDKRVLIIAPGKSSIEEVDKIRKFVSENDVVTISINFAYSDCKIDYIFVSNLKRYREITRENKRKCIVTSNIEDSEVAYRVNYELLLNQYENIKDNAGMMLLQLLKELEVAEIYLAGMDGYSHDVIENYGDEQMVFEMSKEKMDSMNSEMNLNICNLSKTIPIHFLTSRKYI